MAKPMQDAGVEGLIPEAWLPIYHNPLASTSDIAGFQMEGEGALSFPLQRMRLESTISAEAGQKANVVLWCPGVPGRHCGILEVSPTARAGSGDPVYRGQRKGREGFI